MITLEQAKQKALKVHPKINAVIEEPKAYIFSNSKAITKEEKTDNEVVVLKENGKIVSYFEYITEIRKLYE